MTSLVYIRTDTFFCANGTSIEYAVCPNRKPLFGGYLHWFGQHTIACPLCIEISEWRRSHGVTNHIDNSRIVPSGFVVLHTPEGIEIRQSLLKIIDDLEKN